MANHTIWLNQKQMAELFDKDSDTIGLHLKNIYKSRELDKKATTEKYSVVQIEGNREVKRSILFYNLDTIISVGYRVNSKRGTQFRIWANKILKEYLVQGYAINEKRLQEKSHQLQELKKVIRLQERVISEQPLETHEAKGLVEVIANYASALDVLDDYILEYKNRRIGLVEAKKKGPVLYRRRRPSQGLCPTFEHSVHLCHEWGSDLQRGYG